MADGRDFCTECRRETGYILQKRRAGTRAGAVWITAAVCEECGAEMSPPGLIDRNIREADAQIAAGKAAGRRGAG